MKRAQAELKVFQRALRYIENGYGKDKCKGYAPGCPNCEGQILRGAIKNHIALLKWELKEKNQKLLKKIFKKD